MLEILSGFRDRDDLIAVRARGHVSADDYRQVLAPEVRRRIEMHGTVRLLYWLGPEFEGMTPKAVWADARLGIEQWTGFSRMAVVTDVEWVAHAVHALSPFFHAPIRAFTCAELESAKRWIAEPNP